MVLMPYRYGTGESHVVQPISTGLACHTSFEEAASSAICEVIERDAFTIVWQARIAPPRVNLGTLSDLNRDLVRRFEVTGHAVSVFYITLDHKVPVILSVLSNSSHEVPALVFAAAADLDPNVAVRKSLEELAHTRRLAVYLKQTTPPVPVVPPFDSVENQDCHVRLYCEQENAYLADFLFSSHQFISLQDVSSYPGGNPKENLQILLESVKDVGHQALLADLTSPDLHGLGLSVVRAVIPGFHPLFMGHARRALGGERLWRLPQGLGLKGINLCDGDNPVPHPYP